jgi:hypothetical protein
MPETGLGDLDKKIEQDGTASLSLVKDVGSDVFPDGGLRAWLVVVGVILLLLFKLARVLIIKLFSVGYV